MAYYHVLIQRDSKEIYVIDDLNENELIKMVVKPYRKGKDILNKNDVIRTMEIERIQIIVTERKSEIERKDIQDKSFKKIQEMNRSGGPIIISAGHGYSREEVAEAGKDVTREYIKGPPGYQILTLGTIIHNPWVVGIGTTLAAGFLIYKLGFN